MGRVLGERHPGHQRRQFAAVAQSNLHVPHFDIKGLLLTVGWERSLEDAYQTPRKDL